MALDPEEVVNKRFSATKFRQGYDEEEVDEFLDEVVAELRRLNGESDELRTKLSACESRVAELSKQGSRAEPMPAKAAEPAVAPTPAPTPAPAPTPVPSPAPAHVAATSAPSTSGVDSAAGMLALAQRLHDEHVEAGKTRGAKLVTDAQQQAGTLIRDAEEKQRQTLGNLETQRQVLERKVDELRSFEREYRSRLKAYLENQLRDLESTAAPAGARSGDSPALPNRTAPASGGSSTTAGPGTGNGPSTEGPSTPRFPFST